MTRLNFKKLNDLAKIPTQGSTYAAGYDLYAATDKDIIVPPHKTVKIETGIAMSIPENCFGGIFARSGLATKRDLAPANKVGVIDSDYRGEIIIALHNHGNEVQTVEPGERIAQLIILPFVAVEFQEVAELDGTERGEGGFGSTGVK